MRKALAVLDARIDALKLEQMRELRVRDVLRTKQVSITEQEQAIAASLQEASTTDPSMFRFRETRLRKLGDDQRRLQPVLARAAIQRKNVQDALTKVMKQRLGVVLLLEKLEARAPVFQTEEERALVLFEMRKRL